MKRYVLLLALLMSLSCGMLVADAQAHRGWRFGVYAGLPAYYPPPPAYYYAPPPPPDYVARPYYPPPAYPYYYAPPPRAFIGFGF